MTGLAQIRSTFLDFFKSRGHQVVASSPLVPRNDPTLMFANSGMVQFKNVFTGIEKRPYIRATTAQKCVRAGGKHNDLDNVGYTARHHTFFEMLGNFSFGDYFKADAIEWAWTLVTKELGLAKDRLTTTVYSEDDEAHALWKKIAGLPDSRIIRIPTSDNFWSMGDTGPCGPCSEIFFDHGDKIPGGPPGSADADGDRFIEIWNLVFMQYEQVSKAERIPLPRPSIDTGMGLERITAVLQGTHDNYETDLFKALISAIVAQTHVPAEGKHRASNRVIADHLRASSFLIADGVMPSNEGRGYVLRRIMRRAMRHAELLGMKEPLMWKLVPALVREMGVAYPELERAQGLITETLKLEESRFRKTLDRGLRLLDEGSNGLSNGSVFSGDTAFKLYDTYGFPLDLTQDALKSRGISVDTAAFSAAMEAQRAEARKAWKGSGEAKTETVWFDLREKTGGTEFLGYDTEQAEGVVTALVVDGKSVDQAMQGQTVSMLVNQTPFYGESGGQTGDTGVIASVDAKLEVIDTRKHLGDVFEHICRVQSGTIRLKDAVTLTVDRARRSGNRQHHSATHLLHEALRRILGTHVAQKGSLVEPGRLRFDFSHSKPLSQSEIAAVETMANTVVAQNDVVTTRLMSVDAAIAEGAMALFGEKYGDEVRVVSMGRNDASDTRPIYSLELCGGTHVSRTGDIGLIKVMSDSASSAGVRRLEALAGEAARGYLNAQDQRVSEISSLLKSSPADVVARVAALADERRKLERDLAEARRAIAMGGGGQGASNDIEIVNGIKFMSRVLRNVSPQDLKPLADEGKAAVGSGVVSLVAVSADGKGAIVVGVTDDLKSRFNAVALVKAGAAAMGGKGGGGRPDMAQAGGPDGAQAETANSAVKALLSEPVTMSS
jgi:alanyl-tRNA synthetase